MAGDDKCGGGRWLSGIRSGPAVPAPEGVWGAYVPDVGWYLPFPRPATYLLLYALVGADLEGRAGP